MSLVMLFMWHYWLLLSVGLYAICYLVTVISTITAVMVQCFIISSSLVSIMSAHPTRDWKVLCWNVRGLNSEAR